MKFLSLFFLCTLSIAHLYSQLNDSIVIINEIRQIGYKYMVNSKGEVVSVFSNNAYLKTDYAGDYQKHIPTRQSYREFNFQNGLLPVKKGNNYHLVNLKGETETILPDKYDIVWAPSEGYHVARTKVNDSTYYVYLNSKGEEVLNGKYFLRATSIGDGKAIVLLATGKNNWNIFDFKAKEYIPIGKETSRKIKYPYMFSQGYAHVEFNINGNYDIVYINAKGKVALNPRTITKTRMYNHVAMHNGLFICEVHDNFYFIRENGEYLGQIRGVSFGGISDSLVFLDQGGLFDNLMYHSLEPVSFERQDDLIFIPTYLNEKTYGGYLVDTSDQRNNMFAIYDCDGKELVSKFKVKSGPKTFYEDRIVVGEKPTPFYTGLSQILNYNGKIIYSVPDSLKMFNSIELALNNKEKVHFLKIQDARLADSLVEIKNIRAIIFKNLVDDSLDVQFDQLGKLKKVEFENCNNLKALPNSLTNAPKLNTLIVRDCESLNNIESIIEGNKSITRVITTNYNFNEEFIERLTNERPKLKISKWSSVNYFMD